MKRTEKSPEMLTYEAVLKKELTRKYRATTAADGYVLGIDVKGELYVTYLLEMPDDLFRLDTNSDGDYALRVDLNKWTRPKYAGKGCCVGKTDEIFAAMGLDNNGDCFEKYIVEGAGKVWVKNSIPYYEAGDFEIAGKHFQIKFERTATYASKTTIEKRYKEVFGE